MRPIILLLAIPLLVIGAAQVYGVRAPVVLVDVLAAVAVAGVAAQLSRATSGPGESARVGSLFVAAPEFTTDPRDGLSRREWILVGAAWLVIVAAIVTAMTTDLGWAMCTTWTTAMLAAVLMARAEKPSVAIASVVTAVLSVGTPLGDSAQEWLSLALVFLSLVVPVLAVGLVVRNQRRSAVVQREAARDRERRAMAEELHDVIAHEVTGIIVLAQAVRPGVAGTPAAPAIERIEASGQRALDQIRAMMSTARTADGADEVAYAPNVESLSDVRPIVENFADTVPATVHLSLRGEEARVPPQVAMAISRILTEALTNVRRHALSAARVDVTVAAYDDLVRVEVVDDGYGGGVGPGNGTGVAGITERAGLLGGHAAVGRRSDGRWCVSATIPLAAVHTPGAGEAIPAPAPTGGAS